MIDVIIIGGGPGGSALGCYLSRMGISNLIVDSANHPRAHVGESMVTSTTRVFEEIGFLSTLESEGFVRKYGASWHPTTRRNALHVEFSEIPQPGISQPYTYHVDRAKFDLLLLKHAESMGSTVYQGIPVKEVLFDGDTAQGVRVRIGGMDVDIPSRLVVDASGRRTVLGSQLKLKQKDTNFNQFAVHAWFEGVNRGQFPDNIHIHFLPVKRGWIWQIPITDAITSIGVVAEKEVFTAGKADYSAWFESLCNSAPDIACAMTGARRVNDFKIEADYSYQMTQFVGNGWLLVGDAARFVDPIFSSGVSVAMHSAKFASEQICEALSKNDVTREALLPYETRLKAGTEIWYEFIKLYYKLQSVFTVFIAKEEYRRQVIQLLQGDVFNRTDAPVLQRMREFIESVDNCESHLMHAQVDDKICLDSPC